MLCNCKYNHGHSVVFVIRSFGKSIPYGVEKKDCGNDNVDASHWPFELNMQFEALKPFLDHETHGFKRFEEVLTSDRYCTVPEALVQTYGVLCAPSIELPDTPDGNPIVKPPVQVFLTV